MDNLKCTHVYLGSRLSLVVSLLVVLFSAMPGSGQTADSLSLRDSTEVVDPLTQERSTVQQWQIAVKEWDRMLDSVKRRLSWERYTPDTVFMDSVLSFLDKAQREISTLNQAVRENRLQKQNIDKQLGSIDSPLTASRIVYDSVSVPSAGIKDTLQRIDSNIKRLLEDIDYLQSTVSRQVAETKAIGTTPVTLRRLVKTMQKNLITDSGRGNYYGLSAWGNRFLLIICSLLYFYWMFQLGRKPGQGKDSLLLHKNEPVWIPVLKTCVFFLVLLPLTSFTIPVLILEVSYLIIFIILYGLVYKELPNFKRNVLHIILVYYLLLLVVNLFLSEWWVIRTAAICVNVLAIGLLLSIARKKDEENPMGYIHRYARWILLMGNVLAIILTAGGYLNLSRMWSLVAGIGLLQVISLRAFREMLLHDVKNYYDRSDKDAKVRRFDLDRLLYSLGLLLRFCSIVLIVIVLLNNLHWTREAINIWDKVLSTPHQIGGVHFTYGNLLLAVGVVWVANWFQKNLGNLLTNPSTTDLHRQKMALFPLFRLLIIVIGFLLGISILGFGMNKLTVIIGALSVGVGLGLQNIINNFVSGIILVFEKPFKIGDYIEIGDKKGQVMQIGIRSSTLLTDQGARVIIPNGDLLSGRLVNWTFSDSDIRLNMKLTVDNTIDVEEWKAWLKQTVYSFDEIDVNVPIKIWTKDITATTYLITLQVGVKHMRLIERFRSRFLETVKKDMDAKKVKIISS